MQVEKASSVTPANIIHESVPTQNKSNVQADISISSTLPPITPAKDQGDPASNAALQRQAFPFIRNNSSLFILPPKYKYDMFEGNGDLKSNGGLVVLVTGPFGGGKNALTSNAIKVAGDHIQQVVEYTSRAKRPHETEGVEYFFATREEFQRMAENDEILVWGNLTGNFYGFAVDKIQNALDMGKAPVLIQGPNNVGPMKNALEKRGIQTIVAFISPLSREELNKDDGIDKAVQILEERMQGTERNRLAERSAISKAMFESLPKDVHVINNSNGNLERATVDFLSLIQAKKEELRTKSLSLQSPQLKFLETGELPEIHLDTTKMKASKNIAIIVTGPSGVGKDTIFSELAKDKDIKFTEPLSHTTRSKGKGEKEGVNYYYVSRDEFEKMIVGSNLVEWVMVHNGQFYGKAVDTTQRALDSGNDLIYALNASAREYYKAVFKKFDIPYIDIFISPIPKEELERADGVDRAVSILEGRMRKRNRGETEEQIQDRLKVAREWFKEAKNYSHIITNAEGGLNDAVSALKQIILLKKTEVSRGLNL